MSEVDRVAEQVEHAEHAYRNRLNGPCTLCPALVSMLRSEWDVLISSRLSMLSLPVSERDSHSLCMVNVLVVGGQGRVTAVIGHVHHARLPDQAAEA